MDMTDAELSAEYDRLFKEFSGRDPPRDNEATFDDLLIKARQLTEGDTAEARRLIQGAAWMLVDDLDRDKFLNTVKRALKAGAKIGKLLDIWKEAETKARGANAPTPGETAKMEAEAAEARAEQKRAESDRLWIKAKPLTMQPDILADAIETAHLAGVVGEDQAIGAHYLTMTSRVLDESRVLSTLGTGTSSTGKSHTVEKVEIMMPPECVVPITSGSPKSLIYMVADDPEALKHKIVVVHEAAGFIAGNDVDDNPSAAIVREIMTRGRADYTYVERDDDGHLTSKKLVAEGPISLVTTSARDNLDPEMLNRLVSIPGNESPKATRAIQIAQISGVAEKNRPAAKIRVAAHQALQRWLQSAAPIKVVIPEDLRQSIFAALGKLPDTVRTRRDVPAFLLAVKSSAALHMAQRKKDADSGVIATLADYTIAHGAFDRFLAMEYSNKLKPAELVVLAAIEKLIKKDNDARPEDERPEGNPQARISYDKIMAELNMKSRKTLAKRVAALKAAGAISLGDRRFGLPVNWELLTTSAQANRPHHNQFMPAPAEIESLLKNPKARKAKIAEVVDAAGKLPDWAVDGEEGPDDKKNSPEDEEDAP
jgi:hypothetical protein